MKSLQEKALAGLRWVWGWLVSAVKYGWSWLVWTANKTIDPPPVALKWAFLAVFITALAGWGAFGAAKRWADGWMLYASSTPEPVRLMPKLPDVTTADIKEAVPPLPPVVKSEGTKPVKKAEKKKVVTKKKAAKKTDDWSF